MKELLIEQKAKAYDEALERASKLRVQNPFDTVSQMMEYVFPELKEVESEDERIRKEIIAVFKGQIPFTSVEDNKKYVAWLEKQSTPSKLTEEEQNRFAKGVLTSSAMSFIDYLDAHKYEGKMCVSNGECEDIENAFHNAMWDRLHRYYCKYIEKQGKQKSADNNEPKFHEGDWIISNDKKSTYQVIEVKRGIYVIRDNADDHEYYIGIEECEKSGRLWNISDAKDGDVVVDKSDGTIGIFQSIGHHPDGGSCNDTSYCFLHCRYDDGFFYANFENGNTIDSDDLIPATKEQRNLLFQKMEEAGYMWNVNKKKELKKIEKMPSWSEEDGK